MCACDPPISKIITGFADALYAGQDGSPALHLDDELSDPPLGLLEAATLEMKHDISRARFISARLRTLFAPFVIENQNGMPDAIAQSVCQKGGRWILRAVCLYLDLDLPC